MTTKADYNKALSELSSIALQMAQEGKIPSVHKNAIIATLDFLSSIVNQSADDFDSVSENSERSYRQLVDALANNAHVHIMDKEEWMRTYTYDLAFAEGLEHLDGDAYFPIVEGMIEDPSISDFIEKKAKYYAVEYFDSLEEDN